MKNFFDEQLKDIHEVIDGEDGSFPNRLNAARGKCELLRKQTGKPSDLDEARLIRELNLLSEGKQKLQLIRAYDHLINPCNEVFVFWMEQNMNQFLEDRYFRDLYSRLIGGPKAFSGKSEPAKTDAFHELSRLGKIRFINDRQCTKSQLIAIFEGEEDSWVMSQLVKILPLRFPGNEAFFKISKCLDHEDERVRANTVEALTGLAVSGWRAADIEKLLAPMIRDQSTRVRIAYFRYLYQVDDNRVLQLLIDELEKVETISDLRSVAWAIKAVELEVETAESFERKKRELGRRLDSRELEGICLVKSRVFAASGNSMRKQGCKAAEPRRGGKIKALEIWSCITEYTFARIASFKKNMWRMLEGAGKKCKTIIKLK